MTNVRSWRAASNKCNGSANGEKTFQGREKENVTKSQQACMVHALVGGEHNKEMKHGRLPEIKGKRGNTCVLPHVAPNFCAVITDHSEFSLQVVLVLYDLEE